MKLNFAVWLEMLSHIFFLKSTFKARWTLTTMYGIVLQVNNRSCLKQFTQEA